MDNESFFFTLFIVWYFSIYDNLFTFFNNVFQKTPFLMSSKIFFDESDYSESDCDYSESDCRESETNENVVEKPIIRYEDKYLEEFRKMDTELKLDEKEQELKIYKSDEFCKELYDSYACKIEEITNKTDQISVKLAKYENNDCISDEYAYLGETKEQIMKTLLEENNKLSIEMDHLRKQITIKDGKAEFEEQVKEKTNKFMIEQRLERLKNSYVLESTPLGNVLMIYDKDRETFKYYSDNSIPYRYLETVGRKYAKQFGIKQVFIDMEEELKISEEKWEKGRIEKEEKLEKEKIQKEEAIKNNKHIEQKKSVFAKFKNYNKESGSGHVNIGAPPKNSIPNKQSIEKENDKVLLKEKTNRYTYEGKFANFSFIKKIDRKEVNKNYAMTFADFKKMQQIKNNSQ